jgi:protocatechuate 3,4-dioxygenase beta subunit
VKSGQPVSAEVTALLSGAGAVCRTWSEQDEGPYHREDQPSRREITEDRNGLPLGLGLSLGTADGTLLRGGVVEIWHCDASGRYSGFPPPNLSVVAPLATAPRGMYLAGQTFLRGTQMTDQAGIVEFRTIYPGWYPGRTVHIHVIVRAVGRVFTSQLYFPDAATDEVFRRPPYSERPERDTTNATDEIFSSGGEPALLDLTPSDNAYLAAACLRLPLDAASHEGTEFDP